MISKGKSTITLDNVKNIVSDVEIAKYYLGIASIPCCINSPLRQDNNPSFALYSPNGSDINFIDFSTNDRGTIYSLLGRMWGLSNREVYNKVYVDFSKERKASVHYNKRKGCRISTPSSSTLECTVREWKDYDLEYWKSYGITLPWLKYANVYPISHKIVRKDGNDYVFAADKYAYAFAEFKEGKATLKIYQPFNKRGFKWSNKHDKSVISLWTKIPKSGDKLCICSSLKDALCLWSNVGIPAIALQAEGYPISDTAIKELKKRFKNIYIFLDNDAPGLKDGVTLAQKTGFTNIVLPNINGQKDISDLYKSLNNKTSFKNIILPLFE